MLEFTDDAGNGIGKGLCLQLKAGNSHLQMRKDGREVFRIKKRRWNQTWTNQPWPVMLVVGTFASDEIERSPRHLVRERLEFQDVRWMEVSSVLRAAGGQAKEIEFVGERLDMSSVLAMRRKVLKDASDDSRIPSPE